MNGGAVSATATVNVPLIRRADPADDYELLQRVGSGESWAGGGNLNF